MTVSVCLSGTIRLCRTVGAKNTSSCSVSRSATFLAMMTCWGTHRCQEARPQPAGACAALTMDEGHPGVTSLDTLRGGW